MSARIQRREFLAAFAGAAAVGAPPLLWPLPLRAQPSGTRMRRIGVMMSIAEDDPLRASYVGALLEGLRAAGWIEGRNVKIDYRWAGGNIDRMKELAKDLVAARPDAMLAHTSPATIALMRETATIPIVFVTVTEPLTQGLVKSLAHPGGNVTGFTNFEFSMGGKWIEILKEIAPATSQASVIFNPDTAPGGGDIFLRSIEAGARSLAIAVTAAAVRNPVEIEAAISALSQSPGAGLIVPPDVFLVVHREKIIELAARYRVPTIYQYDYFTKSGGLLSYGVDVPDLFRRAGGYIDRFLNGANPAELPVQAPTKFQLVVNLKTAKSLGLTIPESFLLRADEVIE
jgi:putative ABC transport system substrate-binding protein